MFYLILLIAGTVLGETSGFSLNCTNDYVRLMSCHTDAHDCTGLRMTLQSVDGTLTESCVFSSCVKGCCCSTEMILVIGDIFLGSVYKDGQPLHSQNISVYETIKPKTPSISPVSQSNGIYQIQWKTNVNPSIRGELVASVSYQKKGKYSKISKQVHPNINVDTNSFDILGRNLEPSTTYVVSVKTYTKFSVFSDSSEEREFTTASSTNVVLIAVILCLCVVAAVSSAGAFASFVKLKGKVWDNAAKDEKPKLLDIKPGKNVILKPESPFVHSSICVEPLISKEITLSKESLSDTSGRSGQTSGISTASPSLDYANTEPVDMEECVLEALKNAFPIFTPAEDTFSPEGPAQHCAIAPPFEKPSSPTVFENRSYIGTKTYPSNAVDMLMNFDSGYHISSGLMPHDFIIPCNGSAVMETDMLYQPCMQPEEASSDSHNLLTVDYGYQDFEKLVEQSSNAISAEKADECQAVILGLTNSTQTAEGVQAHCAVMPRVPDEIMVDHGYHCV